MAFRRSLAVLALLLGLSPALAPAQTEVDIPTAKRLALTLLRDGQPHAAHEIAATLARRRPNDPEVLILMARSERGTGQFSTAAEAGRRAFSLAESDAHRFLAARATAQALASDGKHTRAQVWLRRAGQYAPGPRAEATIRRDYAYVRSRNPWSFSFSGSIAPTDNANDAPTTNEMVIGGLLFIDPTALPISGTELRFSASAAYRLPASETRHHQFILAYDARRIKLGRSAASIAPGLRDSDLASDRVTVGWSGKFRRPNRPGVFDLSARVFSDWYGGTHVQIGQALAGGYAWNPRPAQVLRFGMELEKLDRKDRPIRSSFTARLRADWSLSLANRDRLGLRLILSKSKSDSRAVAHRAAALRTSYDFARPVLSAQFGLSAEYRDSLFDSALYSPARRHDRSLTLSARATFPKLEIYGFAPMIELRRERNLSNIARFDTSSTQLSLSLRSTY